MPTPWLATQQELDALYRRRYLAQTQQTTFESAAGNPELTKQQTELISSYLQVAPQLRVVPSLLYNFAQEGISADADEFVSVAKVLSPDRVAQLQSRTGTEESFLGSVQAAIATAQIKDNPLVGKVSSGSGWFDGPMSFVKNVTRDTTAVVSFPTEFGTNALMNLSQSIQPDSNGILPGGDPSTRDYSASTGDLFRGTSLFQTLSGEDTGGGFFTGSDAAAEAVRQQRRVRGITSRGRALTPGRAVASAFTDEGTTAYQLLSGTIDLGYTTKIDPANALFDAAAAVKQGKKAVDVAKSARETALLTDLATQTGRSFDDLLASPGARQAVIEAAGGYDSVARAVDGQSALQWLESSRGRAVIDRIAVTTDGRALHEALGSDVPIDFVNALRNADNPDDVRALLHGALGIDLEHVPNARKIMQINELGYRTHRRMDDIRLLHTLPGRVLHLDDKNQVWKTLDDALVNGKVNQADRDILWQRVADATTRAGLFDTAEWAMGRIERSLLTEYGVDERAARSMTRMFANTSREASRYFTDEIGRNVTVDAVTVGGEHITLDGPHLLSEGINSLVPMPDPRAIRRHASMFGRYLNHTTTSGQWFDRAVVATDFIFNDLWKPAQLMRLAWPMRVVGEEQIRIAANGGPSAFHHPMSWLATVIADPDLSNLASQNRIQRALTTLGYRIEDAAGNPDANLLMRAFSDALENRRLSDDVLGQSMIEQARDRTSEIYQASAHGRGRYGDPAVQQLGLHRLVVRGEDDFVESWAGEIHQLHGDQLSRKAAQDMLSGAGPEETLRWIENEGRQYADEFATFGDDYARAMADPNARRAYVDSIYDRIRIKTAGDDSLVDAVASGRFNGEPIGDFTARRNASQALSEHLDNMARDGIGPEEVKGHITVRTRSTNGGRVLGWWDQAVDRTMEALMSTPTNKLSRHPQFMDSYWREVERVFPYVDPEVQRVLVDGAPAELAKRLRPRMGPGGDLTLRELDAHAKFKALNETKKLLYDISERGQLSDILRFVVPFGEAWKEVVTRWAALASANPRVPWRLDQINKFVTGTGEDIFTRDPTTGELMMPIPGSTFVNEAIAGVPIPLTAPVSGLNLASQGMPGLGPALSIPAAAILPDTPDWNWARDIIMPYGETDVQSGWLEALMPGWAQKLRMSGLVPGTGRSPEQERIFAQSVRDVAVYLGSSGEYDMTDPEDVDRLQRDARRKAQSLWLVRGMVQFASPASPKFNMIYEDRRDGTVFMLNVIKDDYRDALSRDPSGAAFQMMQKYGDDVLLALQPGSYPRVYGLQPTKPMADWVGQNKGVVKRYPDIYPLLFDGGAQTNDDFSYTEYLREIRTGDRVALADNEQGFADWVALAQHRVASAVYDRIRQKMPDTLTAEQSAYLRDVVKPAISKDFPGWRTDVVDRTHLQYQPGGQWDAVIDSFRKATTDKRLAGNKTVEAIGIYLTLRDKALASAKAAGLASFAEADAAAPIRAWLRDSASRIIDDYHTFSPVWDEVFSREGKMDETNEILGTGVGAGG